MSLSAASHSLLTQTLTDLDLVVIDGSTDDSDRVLCGYAPADPGISVLRIPRTA
jgi:hypothetical protein